MLCHCGRQIKKPGATECAICRGKHRFPVPCPICGRMRMLTAIYSQKEECRQAACNACSRQPDYQDMWKAKREAEAQAAHGKIKTKFRPGSTIELNGCVLIRAGSGRCAGWNDCKFGAHSALYVPDRDHTHDCGFHVGKKLWPGFRTNGPCRSTIPSLAERREAEAAAHPDRPSCAGLCVDA